MKNMNDNIYWRYAMVAVSMILGNRQIGSTVTLLHIPIFS